MPARRDYTPEELQEQLERRRAQSRSGMARLRQQRRLANTVNLTDAPGKTGAVNPPGPPVLPPTSKEVDEVEGVLARFADRGYQHDVRWWLRLAQTCPDVDLFLECSNLAEWLLMPVHRKDECNKRRIGRWMRKAQADAEAAQQPRRAAPAPVKGVVTNGVYHPPASMQKTPDPELPAVPWGATGLARFSPEEEARMREQQARVPFKERLAAKLNGVHR